MKEGDMSYILVKSEDRTVPFHQVPLKDRLALEENLMERQKRLIAKSKELNEGLDGLRADYQRVIRGLIGEEKYKANLEKLQKICQQFNTDPNRLVLNNESEMAEQKLRRRLAREKHDFYHQLGFDTKKAVAIRKETVAKAKSITNRLIDLDLGMAPGPPAPEPKPTNNPWSWYMPPYSHQWNSIQYSGGSAGSIWRSANSSATTGEINLMSWIQLYGAGDSDWLKTDAMCEVGFWFMMPAAGILEVWAWFQDINSDYSGFLYDESGCSDADVHQLSRLYLWTGGSTERYVTTVDYTRGESEGTWSDSLTAPGAIIARQFFSQKAYAAGEWVYAAIGVRDYDYFWVDDMSCRSRMYSQYFVKQVALRSTGAP
jgi:hypothetical protein